MKYLSEYRDKKLVQILAVQIALTAASKIKIMEVCGSQTHSILKYALADLLPDNIELIHGPGCPVCVTPISMIDKAIYLSGKKEVVIASFGDMLRIPGTEKDLIEARANGADVRIIYSPLDALDIAKSEPNKKIVFFSIGFETTAPANAFAIRTAKKLGLTNFFVLCSHVLIPPALDLLLSSNNLKLDGILAPGHVCTITGTGWCENISAKNKIPIVVTGFEPIDIMKGILMLCEEIEANKHSTLIQYNRVVNEAGNSEAQTIMNEVFSVTDREWRGIGIIPKSGLKLNDEYASLDAENVFDMNELRSKENEKCIAGQILQGIKKPTECELFGNECLPNHPVGAPMVSSEGACAAYYKYKMS